VVNDLDLAPEDRTSRSLILYGTPATNAVLRDWATALEIEVGPGVLRIANREWRDERIWAFAVRPHPEHPARIVAMHGGPAPDAVTWGSHLDLALLPDYLVGAGPDVVDWGFWDNRWRGREDR
jgi:hypothetical protein